MRKIILLILFSQLTFSQSSTTLVDKINNTIDVFVANPTPENLQKTESSEKLFSPKTKPDLLAIVILNCNIAYYENQFGQTNKAILSYEKAWGIFQKNKLTNFDITENCLKPLGNLYTIIGDYDNAENIIKQYYFLADANKDLNQKIAAVINLSNVIQNSGRVNLAISLLKETIKSEKLTESQKGILLSSLGANHLILNQNKEAKIAIEKAIKLLETQKNQTQNLSNCYKNLSTIYFQNKDFLKANSCFETSENYLSKTFGIGKRAAAKNYYDHALLFYNEQNFDRAIEYINLTFSNLTNNYNRSSETLPNKKILFADTVLLDAIDLRAEIYSDLNQPKKALEAYQLSFYIEDLFSNLLVYENSKIINQIRVRNRVEKCIALYDLLFQKEKKISYLETAFELCDKTKSSVLKNYLANYKTASVEEKTDLEQLQNLNTEIVKEQQKLNYADISKINTAIQKQNQIMLSLKNIRAKNPKLVAENYDLKSLYYKLENDNATMIEFFSGSQKMYSFSLENNKIALNSFENNGENKSKISTFLDYFGNPDAITNNVLGYNDSGKTVFDLLQLPSKKNNKNLIIIPDGILNFVPFEALITKKSTTTNFAKMNYFLKDFRIAYNNSASVYGNTKLVSGDKKTVLGIFPVFEKTDYELTFSKKELKSIKNNFDGKFFENSSATFDNFKKNAAHYSILHLSTHGNSGDTEVPASIKFYDQDVLYSEFYNLKINPDLVVLSACETGIGKLYKSEGAMSMARGFQAAGAQNLLFSLWKVNDYTTAIFMDKFYKNIKNDKSFFVSNHQAKLDFLKKSSVPNAKKSPHYRSAFVYYGAIENKDPSINYWFWILVIIGIIGLFLLLKKYFIKKNVMLKWLQKINIR
jgi:hypothetical protein